VAALLLAWEPLNFAPEALLVLPSIGYRGWIAAVELAVHAAVAALAAAAGLALWNGSPDGKRLATIAIVAALARNVQSLYWSALPNATLPGDETLTAGITLFVGALALATLHVARRT
jgi:hypothetical protein